MATFGLFCFTTRALPLRGGEDEYRPLLISADGKPMCPLRVFLEGHFAELEARCTGQPDAAPGDAFLPTLIGCGRTLCKLPSCLRLSARHYAHLRLLLLQDVETNPGPPKKPVTPKGRVATPPRSRRGLSFERVSSLFSPNFNSPSVRDPEPPAPSPGHGTTAQAPANGTTTTAVATAASPTHATTIPAATQGNVPNITRTTAAAQQRGRDRTPNRRGSGTVSMSQLRSLMRQILRGRSPIRRATTPQRRAESAHRSLSRGRRAPPALQNTTNRHCSVVSVICCLRELFSTGVFSDEGLPDVVVRAIRQPSLEVSAELFRWADEQYRVLPLGRDAALGHPSEFWAVLLHSSPAFRTLVGGILVEPSGEYVDAISAPAEQPTNCIATLLSRALCQGGYGQPLHVFRPKVGQPLAIFPEVVDVEDRLGLRVDFRPPRYIMHAGLRIEIRGIVVQVAVEDALHYVTLIPRIRRGTQWWLYDDDHAPPPRTVWRRAAQPSIATCDVPVHRDSGSSS
eukprot:PhM_4_TR18853/c1_g1_i1/m.43408